MREGATMYSITTSSLAVSALYPWLDVLNMLMLRYDNPTLLSPCLRYDIYGDDIWGSWGGFRTLLPPCSHLLHNATLAHRQSPTPHTQLSQCTGTERHAQYRNDTDSERPGRQRVNGIIRCFFYPTRSPGGRGRLVGASESSIDN
jgi:hypothetical protein